MQEAFFSSILFRITGKEAPIDHYEMIYGGDINLSVKVESEGQVYFIKYNSFADASFFKAEENNLLKMGAAFGPQVIHRGQLNDYHYLVLEFIPNVPFIKSSWEKLGRKLALLHQRTSNHCGLDYNNYIGKLEQQNLPRNNNWADFYIQKRLDAQAGLAYYNGILSLSELKSIQKIYAQLDNLLPKNSFSLLHGDLWSGNVLSGVNGNVYFIDPACYYGHSEIDLAMTKLFGGFDEAFYDSYHEIIPQEKGAKEREEIYKMYPLLVHVNLFGRSYLKPVLKTAKKFTTRTN